jgi:tetratricopeptide (TPR) repeat protein
VVGIGVVIFVLLLFADKTNLTNQSDSPGLESNTVEVDPGQQKGNGNLPPLAPDEKMDNWLGQLDRKEGLEKARLLDSIVVTLQSRNRFAYAADFAQQRLTVESSLENKLQAGELAQKATRLDFVLADSSLFRKYSSMSIRILEGLLREEPENERALLALGLAYTESRIPQNSMKGIQSLLKVLEMNPKNVEASFNLGMFSLQTGQYEKAEQRFRNVLDTEPQNPSALFQLAIALDGKGDRPGAKEILQSLKARQLDPEMKAAVNRLLKDFES